ncbi:MAG TPA: hypothetical protein VHV57_08470 [Acidimicrobiales bacterium]|jgi:hypothetical protein|nr:hypothetical protein [Acidimicrobiales bacterium]
MSMLVKEKTDRDSIPETEEVASHAATMQQCTFDWRRDESHWHCVHERGHKGRHRLISVD